MVQGLEIFETEASFFSLTSHLKVPWRFEMARSAASLLEYLTKAHPDRGTLDPGENDVPEVSLSSSTPIVSTDTRGTMTCHLAVYQAMQGGGGKPRLSFSASRMMYTSSTGPKEAKI